MNSGASSKQRHLFARDRLVQVQYHSRHGRPCCQLGRIQRVGPRELANAEQLPRVALPLFFERAVIEITPERCLLWEDGDTSREPLRFLAPRAEAA